MTKVPPRLSAPMYSFSEADRLAGATRGTARRWILGYSYVRDGVRVSRPPVTPRSGEAAGASFLDLLEVVVIERLKGVGFTLGDVRRVVMNCIEVAGLQRPLVEARFKTDGRDIFVERGDALLEVGRRKRMLAWNSVLAPFLQELSYDGEWAARWWPLGKDRGIVIDPDFGFGQPVIEGTGVRTEIVIERVRAGDTFDEIAQDFNVSRHEIEKAIQYEASRIAA